MFGNKKRKKIAKRKAFEILNENTKWRKFIKAKIKWNHSPFKEDLLVECKDNKNIYGLEYRKKNISGCLKIHYRLHNNSDHMFFYSPVFLEHGLSEFFASISLSIDIGVKRFVGCVTGDVHSNREYTNIYHNIMKTMKRISKEKNRISQYKELFFKNKINSRFCSDKIRYYLYAAYSMLEYAIYKEPNGNILKAVEDFIWLKNRLVEDINRIEKKGVFLLDT